MYIHYIAGTWWSHTTEISQTGLDLETRLVAPRIASRLRGRGLCVYPCLIKWFFFLSLHLFDRPVLQRQSHVSQTLDIGRADEYVTARGAITSLLYTAPDGDPVMHAWNAENRSRYFARIAKIKQYPLDVKVSQFQTPTGGRYVVSVERRTKKSQNMHHCRTIFRRSISMSVKFYKYSLLRVRARGRYGYSNAEPDTFLDITWCSLFWTCPFYWIVILYWTCSRKILWNHVMQLVTRRLDDCMCWSGSWIVMCVYQGRACATKMRTSKIQSLFFFWQSQCPYKVICYHMAIRCAPKTIEPPKVTSSDLQ